MSDQPAAATPAVTPAPPYYAVIFTSRLKPNPDGYSDTADRMEALAKTQPGYLGFESARGPDGLGISVSYWASEEAIVAWKAVLEHKLAQAQGRREWYRTYQVRVARVERGYGFEA